MTKILCRLLTVVILFASSALAEDAPDWLRQAAAMSIPDYNNKADYVVLYNEANLTVEPNGQILEHTRYAMKVLLKDGRDAAEASVSYESGRDKIQQFQAWIIPSSGKVRKYEKKEVKDVALVSFEVFNDERAKVISGRVDAEVGSVFGYESVVETNPWFAQTEWSFQESNRMSKGGRWVLKNVPPVLVSRLRLEMPPGWTAQSITFNHAPIEPVVSGSTYSWELKELPLLKPEPMRPAVGNIVPRLGVSFFPPANASLSKLWCFKNWIDVSLFGSELNDPQLTIDEAMKQKVKELTASCATNLDKIRAIGRFVQDISYVAVEIGLGGYQPHSATSVFANRYGDCKDKANLLRAMLKVAGITAYLVDIFSSDRYFVREEWPSPAQFNHVISAIAIEPDAAIGSTIQHEKLGRLLLFDPTDPYTIVGDLPQREQGSFAVLAAGKEGGLIKVPTAPPDANRVVRNTQIELRADGSIQAMLKEELHGQAGKRGRGTLQELTPDNYRRAIEAWISRTVTGSMVQDIKDTDKPLEGNFQREISFSAENYGKFMNAHLMAIIPAAVSYQPYLALSQVALTDAQAQRKFPIVIDEVAFAETAEINLPDDFSVDELPDPVKIESSFGLYNSHCEVAGQKLRYQRSWTLQNAILPPEQFKVVQKFYNDISAAEHAPVVLLKK